MFVLGKPHSTGSSERIQLSGMYNVRKGKMQLPVNRWTRRQVILCGTCLIVSSVKDSVSGKMHVLPLIGGKVSKARILKHIPALVRPSSISVTRGAWIWAVWTLTFAVFLWWALLFTGAVQCHWMAGEDGPAECHCSVLGCRWWCPHHHVGIFCAAEHTAQRAGHRS